MKELTINGYTAHLERVQYSEGGRIYHNVRIYTPDGFPQIYPPKHEGAPYTIQTTSWGALPIDKTKEVVARYQAAVKTAEKLGKVKWDDVSLEKKY